MPDGSGSLVERSRAAAAEVDVIVTNHSFMAIDSLRGRQMLLRNVDVLVVDEAHGAGRSVTSTITDELTAGADRRGLQDRRKRSERSQEASRRPSCSASILEGMPEGRVLNPPEALVLALTWVRDVAWALQSDLKPQPEP
ncbi:MAG: ATP-dependent DNA helicase, partial [Actinomycetales bacterium]|nr:ATP-dependent DNA helicase [Actinomycetales bacterium]